ncbi:MAG: YciI family protein [Betaproteobacteria bacterium]|nr:YciI family protein [Betaproteobacteria bacterium]
MYALICFDRPDSAALRDAHRAAHVEFLNANAARIVFGGPLKGTPDGPSTGALIVVDCATHEQAEALIGADPFYCAGVYESVAIRAFKRVFPPQ